jgi:hypothetical protein
MGTDTRLGAEAQPTGAIPEGGTRHHSLSRSPVREVDRRSPSYSTWTFARAVPILPLCVSRTLTTIR